MTTYNRSLHIFRRDLRIEDNTALNAALVSSKEVIPCFIFNDAQVAPHPYRSVNGLAFMIESLRELSSDISKAGGELLVLHGTHHDVVARLIKELSIDAVFFNKDYTPFSRKRDKAIEDACKAAGVACEQFSDALLVEPSQFGKDDGRPYTVYTPFFKKAAKLEVSKPVRRSTGTLAGKGYRGKTVSLDDFWPKDASPQRISIGGRSLALTILERIKDFKNYEEERNLPAVRGTTLLAPHNKFGTVSIREAYHTVAKALGPGHTLIRELYWRDFFTHIAWHFPHVFGHAFHKEYDQIEWNDDRNLFKAWCEGRTGFPIVDAGMRELVATGFMHNRVRMIVASFLVKDLHISWQKGEQFFARYLTDYDPAVNNGSWQWAASTGCDAQPYFRIFNPWLQQKRFDPECVYIKRWVPELKQLKSGYIHTMYEDDMMRSVDYPHPIVEHSIQKIHAEEMFRKALKKA
jgi:deoxyribodipyrimidine photo-lyase